MNALNSVDRRLSTGAAKAGMKAWPTKHPNARWSAGKWLLAAVAATCGITGLGAASAAPITFNYTGTSLVYSPNSPGLPPFTTYGTRVLAEMTLDDSFIQTSFSGVLDSTQFSASIGTDGGYPLLSAGTWRLPTSGQVLSAFVSLRDGEIVDWSFGSVRTVLGNQITIGSTGHGDTILPFPRVVNWGTASTAVAGHWMAPPNPVPVPTTPWLLVAAVAACGLATRAASRRAGVGVKP